MSLCKEKNISQRQGFAALLKERQYGNIAPASVAEQRKKSKEIQCKVATSLSISTSKQGEEKWSDGLNGLRKKNDPSKLHLISLASKISRRRQIETNHSIVSLQDKLDGAYNSGREKALSMLGIEEKAKTDKIDHAEKLLNKEDNTEMLALASTTSLSRSVEVIRRETASNYEYQKGRTEAFSLLGIKSKKNERHTKAVENEDEDILLLASTISSKRQSMLKEAAMNVNTSKHDYKRGREKAFSVLGIKSQSFADTKRSPCRSFSSFKYVTTCGHGTEREAGFAGAMTVDGSADKLQLASNLSVKRHQKLKKIPAAPLERKAYMLGRDHAFALLGVKGGQQDESTLNRTSSSCQLSLSALQRLISTCESSRRDDKYDLRNTNPLSLASDVSARRNLQLRRVIARRDPVKYQSYKRDREKAFSLLACPKEKDEMSSSWNLLSTRQVCKETLRSSSCVESLTESRELRQTNPLSLASCVAKKRYIDLKETVCGRQNVGDESYQRGRDAAMALLSKIDKLDSQEVEVEIETRNEGAGMESLNSSCIDDCTAVCARRCGGSNYNSETFPEKLHRMLREVEATGRENTISFLPHGRAFIINCQVKFVHESMPNYFRFARLSSFEHQLFCHGFRKISSGPDSGAYFHELFLKDHPKLLTYIKRVEKGGSINNAAA